MAAEPEEPAGAKDRTQVHVWLPTPMVERVDGFAEARGISRSSAIAVLLARGLGMNGEPGAP